MTQNEAMRVAFEKARSEPNYNIELYSFEYGYQAALSALPRVSEEELEAEIHRVIAGWMNGTLPDDERIGSLRKCLARALFAKFPHLERK